MEIVTTSLDAHKAAFGVFRRRVELQTAKTKLMESGFDSSVISVLHPSHPGAKDFPSRQKSNIKNGAIIGAALGGLVFFVLGVMLSLRTAPITAFDLPDFLNSPLALIATGVLGGLLFGAAAGALVGIGTPQRAELRYGDYVDAGGMLLSVHVKDADEALKAQTILESAGAEDINLLEESHAWESIYSKLFRPEKKKAIRNPPSMTAPI